MQFGDMGQIKRRIGEKLNDNHVIRCPRCGYDNVHVSVEDLTPEDTGTRQGGCAVIFTGECGHVWADIYAEHKGCTVKVPVLWELTFEEEGNYELENDRIIHGIRLACKQIGQAPIR